MKSSTTLQNILVERLESRDVKPRPSIKRFGIKAGPLAEEMIEGFGAIESQFGDYSEEFGGFAKQTNENFVGLDTKYGEISQKLTQILEELRTENRDSINSLNKSVEALLQAVDKLPNH